MPLYIGSNSIRRGRILIINKDPSAYLGHEVIERKGVGHPDSIADGLASRISRNYARYTTENCDGMILHHQIDKLMVIGGKEDVSWGSGRFLEPVKVIVAGRVSRSYLGKPIPANDIVDQTIVQYFSEMFPLLNVKTDLKIHNELTSYAGPGTIRESKGAISNMFNPVSKNSVRGYEKLVANDTSFCVGYAPYTPLETAILETEAYLNSPEAKLTYPWLGSDIKIMGVKEGDRVDLTACIPQIAIHVNSLESYRENLDTVGKIMIKLLCKWFPEDGINLSLNTKDDYEMGNVYLTVTGSSLAGDIGVVGRGNRVNGLITSRRPMSLEGVSGKNPRYYSGFIYSILSNRLANEIYKRTERPCDVEIVSQNGGNLLYPWFTIISTPFEDQDIIRQITEDGFKQIPAITKDFLDGKITTC